MMFVDQTALFNHVLEGFLHQCANSQRAMRR